MSRDKAVEWSDAQLDLLDNVYQLQCLSRMNAIYYELRLAEVQFLSFWMEISIAATASGSGLASLLSNKSGPLGEAAQVVWPLVAILSAIAAIVRPIYSPGKKIETLTRQHQGYAANFFALQKLAFAIRQEGSISNEHRRRFDTFYDRHVQLSTDAKASEDEAAPKDKHRAKAEARTRLELPAEKFWWPAQNKASAPEAGGAA